MDRAMFIVAECDAPELSDFISAIIGMGYCVSFTGTSDRGAVSITVFDGAVRWKQYARGADELLTCYRDLLAAIRGEE
jgi:hypothetical protein